MRHSLLRPGTWCIAATCALLPARSQAQPAQLEARARFNRGVELYRDGDLAAALAEFRRAYALAPAYRLQYNIAQVCREQHDYACALSALRDYLGGGGAAIPPQKRSSIEQEAQRLSEFVSELTILVDLAGAEVLLDDTSLGTAPLGTPILVNVGRHRVSARQGALVATRVVEAAGSERTQVSLLLAPAPAPPPTFSSASEPATSRAISPDRSLAWASGIGAGVFLAGATVTGIFALHESRQLASERSGYPASSEQLHSTRDKVSSLALATDILGLLALGSGAGAVYFALRPAGPPTQPAAALSISGRF